MKKTETMVAVVPQVDTADEQQLSRDVTDIEFKAEAFVIQSDADYAEAGKFGRLLKQKASEVTAFFKPMKDSAYQAHKAVCDREKAMLSPLKNAEKIIKKSMGDYIAEQEAKRRADEEAARKAAEEERERKLLEAEELEKAGDSAGADEAMEEAVVMDEAASYNAPAMVKPKATGVSTTKDWEIVSVDSKAVPMSIAGVEIRPVDKAAVMRLIRVSKGNIEIPGITYRQIAKMSFRR